MDTLQNTQADSQPVNVEVIKQHAKRMGVAFKEKGIKLKHSEVLDLVSRGFGFNGYQAANGFILKHESLKPMLSAPPKSCCVVDDEGMERLSIIMSYEYTAMISCPIVERMELYALLGSISRKEGNRKVWIFVDDQTEVLMINCIQQGQEK